MSTSLVPLDLIDDPPIPVRALSVRKLAQMRDSLDAGASFPPVGITPAGDDRYMVWNGLHRTHTYRNASRDLIPAYTQEFTDDGELWLAMLEANRAHGDRLSTFEEELALTHGESIGLTRERVADALWRTVESLERRRVTAAVRVGRKVEPLVLKQGLRQLKGSVLNGDQAALHRAYAGGRPIELLRSLAIVCELGALPPLTPTGRSYAERVVIGLSEWLATGEVEATA